MPLIIEGKECACMGDPTSHGSPLAPGPGALTVLYNGRPIWRVGIDFHACPVVKGVVPDVGGVVAIGALRTLVMGAPAARKTDIVVEVPGGPNPIIPGAFMAGSQAGQVMDAVVGELASVAKSVVEAFESPAVQGAPASDEDDESKSLGSMWNDLKDSVEEKYDKTVGDYDTESYKGVKIEGNEEYRKKVKEDLDALDGSESGRKTLEKLQQQADDGKGVTIKKHRDGNTTHADNANDAFPTDAGVDPATGKLVVNTPGKGTSSTVGYDPDAVPENPDGSDGRPARVGLNHELNHAVHNGAGENGNGTVDPDTGKFTRNDPVPDPVLGNTNHEEARTTGMPPYDAGSDGGMNDNGLRKEMGLPQRDSHGESNPQPSDGSPYPVDPITEGRK